MADWYNALYYKQGPGQDPLGPDAGKARSVRSTGYKAAPDQVPASVRFFRNPGEHARDLGFRCVVADPTYFAPFCSQVSLFGTGPGGGSPGNGEIKYDCPDVSINSQPQSCKDQFTYVTVNDSHSPDPLASIGGLGSCTLISGSLGSYPQVYKCTAPTTASIQSLCTFTYNGSAQCAPHYTLDSGTGICEWDGSGTTGDQCLAGYTYNPVKQCCSATSGSAENYPLCGAGATLIEDAPSHYVCLPNNAAPNPPGDSQVVMLPGACGSPGTSCPNGQTFACVPDTSPKCTRSTTPCPPICSCQ